MENVQEIMPPKTPIQSETMSFPDCITPPPLQHKDENSQNSGNDIHKTTTPDRLKVPKAFKFPERYTIFQYINIYVYAYIILLVHIRLLLTCENNI